MKLPAPWLKQSADWYARHQVTPQAIIWIEANSSLPSGYIVIGDFVCFDTTKVTPRAGKYYLTHANQIIDAETAAQTNAKIIGECFYREGDGKDYLAA